MIRARFFLNYYYNIMVRSWCHYHHLPKNVHFLLSWSPDLSDTCLSAPPLLLELIAVMRARR